MNSESWDRWTFIPWVQGGTMDLRVASGGPLDLVTRGRGTAAGYLRWTGNRGPEVVEVGWSRKPEVDLRSLRSSEEVHGCQPHPDHLVPSHLKIWALRSTSRSHIGPLGGAADLRVPLDLATVSCYEILGEVSEGGEFWELG